MIDGSVARWRSEHGISIGAMIALHRDGLDEVQELYDQLDATLPRLQFGTVQHALTTPGVTVFAAIEDATGRVVGVTTLVAAPTLPRMRAWAEDLVVHPDFRGRKIAEALMDACAEVAAEAGARTMEGTVHPTRTAAIALHKRAGWEFGPSLVVCRHLPPPVDSR